MNVIKGKLSNSLDGRRKELIEYDTIFDYDLTEEERLHLTKARNKEEYLKEVNYSRKICCFNLYSLYCIREDYESADKYFYEAMGGGVIYGSYRAPKNGSDTKNLSDDEDMKEAIKKAKKLALGSP